MPGQAVVANPPWIGRAKDTSKRKTASRRAADDGGEGLLILEREFGMSTRLKAAEGDEWKYGLPSSTREGKKKQVSRIRSAAPTARKDGRSFAAKSRTNVMPGKTKQGRLTRGWSG